MNFVHDGLNFVVCDMDLVAGVAQVFPTETKPCVISFLDLRDEYATITAGKHRFTVLPHVTQKARLLVAFTLQFIPPPPWFGLAHGSRGFK
jgi:hypothetical protein